MSFSPRLSAPSTTNKCYIHTSYGGYNSCIRIKGNSVLPNCVGYAWGRAREILGSTPKLSRGNAETWYGFSDGYSRGRTPKLGAIIVWAKGRVGNSRDGAGHVAVVEQIHSNGSFTVSQSGYRSRKFWTSIIPKSGYLRGYRFLGFIYLPISTSSSSGSSSRSYKVGSTYTLKANLRVRKSAGGVQKKRSELTSNARSHSFNQTYAVLRSGTRVTVLAIRKAGRYTWVQIPSGWVCAIEGGRVYIS
jgi:surface antigen